VLVLVLGAGLALVGGLAASRTAPNPPRVVPPAQPPGAAVPAGEEGRPRPQADLPAGAVARFGTLRFRHPNLPVRALAYSPDGKRIASAGDRVGIILWDAVTGKEVRRLRHDPHREDALYAACFTRDGKEVRSGPHRWETATGKYLGASPIRCSCFVTTPDGTIVAVANPSKIFILDPVTGRERHQLRAPWEGTVVAGGGPMSVSPDGKLLAVQGRKGVVFWDVRSGKQLATTLEGARFPLVFAPDGKVAATGGYQTAARLWDVKTGKALRWLREHEGPVNALAFSRDGKFLATACRGGPIRVWNAAAGRELSRCVGHPGPGPLAFAPDGKTLATGGSDNCVRLWETVTGKERFTRHGHRFGAHAAVFLPDGRMVLSAERQVGVNLWRARTGEGVGLLTRLPHDSRDVALRADGRVAAVNLGGGKFQLWDVAKRTLTREFQDARFVSAVSSGWFSPWQMALARGDVVALTEGTHFGVCRTPGRAGWVVREEKGWGGCAVALSEDGKKLATVSYLIPVGGDGTPRRYRVRLWDTATGKRIPTWEGDHLPQWTPVALSADGARVAINQGTAKENRGRAAVFDTATGKLVRAFESQPVVVTGLAFSGDAGALAVGAGGTVFVWDVATGRLRRRFTGHTGSVCALGFSPDGRRLVSGCDAGDHTLLVWDVSGRPGGKE
jgi:WD40 repeat protein